MSALPIAAGSAYPDLSTLANGALLPSLFSTKCTVKHYAVTVGPEIANSDWEGEIKGMGSKLTIRRTPDANVIDGDKDVDLEDAGLYNTPTKAAVEFEINAREIYGFAIDDVDRWQSDLSYMDGIAEDAVEKVGQRQDRKLFARIATEVAATNKGVTAGIDADINLGATGAPVIIDPNNALKFIARMNLVLDGFGVSKRGRKLTIGPKFKAMLLQTDIRSALVTGDDEGSIRNGRLGMIDGTTIYESILLPHFTDGANKTEQVFLGHSDGLTWATQYMLVEQIRRERKFSSAMRGQVLWGSKVVEPTYWTTGYVAYDTSDL
jgi:hypothetical protein